ncbi:MAG: diguanylate cyclase [Planctomycetota bacterium]
MEQASSIQSDRARPRALVIDDSAPIHRLLSARLQSEGLELLEALDGPTGLEVAKAERPDLILLDLTLIGMDGFEVMRQLKDDPATIEIPIIVLSGLQSAEDKVMAFDLGAIDYVTKPFDLTELRARVRSAMRQAQLLRMLAQRAQIDGLTGLYNRAHFDDRWPEAISSASRHNRALSIAMFDLDHFKSINDMYGHPAGDAAIQGLGNLLQSQCRDSDIICRFGGEEFAVIMPETAPSEGTVLCERIRAELEQMTWPRHPDRTITVSIGLCGRGADGGSMTPEAWLEAADKNLYAAKEGGRNRVHCTDIEGARVQLAKAG